MSHSLAIHEMTDGTDVVLGNAALNARFQRNPVIISQKFHTESGAAQRKQRLLDSPEVSTDAWQIEELFNPCGFHRLLVNHAQPGVESLRQFQMKPGPDILRANGVDRGEVGIDGVFTRFDRFDARSSSPGLEKKSTSLSKSNIRSDRR